MLPHVFKTGENVSGKERFGPPNGLARPAATKSNFWREDLRADFALKQRRDFAFLFGAV